MKTKVAVAGAALWALTSVGIAHAQGPGAPPHDRAFGPGFGHGRLAEELSLSDEQKSQLEALRGRQQETLKPLAEAARQAHETFRSALEADGADAATVGQAALAMHAAEKKLRAAHDAAFEEMKAILTPEQRDKLEKMHEGRRGARGPHGPGGLGPRP
ncbi:MAG TPA: Spy/CpxP family protein refolding chaperone [Vicinamibacteria bacterium]|nr:Spy/CpxP family protein refolding chaperone [Vicinamibacteria bacterium]